VKSVADSPEVSKADPTRPRANQEFIIVSHSLGSYLIFFALDTDQTIAETRTIEQSGSNLKAILERTSVVYFFAHQLRLLELVSLDGQSERNVATHLEDLAQARCEYLKSFPGGPPRSVSLPNSCIE
jgi:hypothetical protein